MKTIDGVGLAEGDTIKITYDETHETDGVIIYIHERWGGNSGSSTTAGIFVGAEEWTRLMKELGYVKDETVRQTDSTVKGV